MPFHSNKESRKKSFVGATRGKKKKKQPTRYDVGNRREMVRKGGNRPENPECGGGEKKEKKNINHFLSHYRVAECCPKRIARTAQGPGGKKEGGKKKVHPIHGVNEFVPIVAVRVLLKKKPVHGEPAGGKKKKKKKKEKGKGPPALFGVYCFFLSDERHPSAKPLKAEEKKEGEKGGGKRGGDQCFLGKMCVRPSVW